MKFGTETQEYAIDKYRLNGIYSRRWLMLVEAWKSKTEIASVVSLELTGMC